MECVCMGRNNVRRAVQMDPTSSCYASAITEQLKKCWELLAQTFHQFETLCNNCQQNDMQQHATECAKGRNM